MGSLRFVLACAVVIAHSQAFFGFMGIGGQAVPAFFCVSGFYMSLVLQSKYRNAAGTFYLNRFLRLMPSYWAVLLLTVAATHIPGELGALPQRVAVISQNAVTRATDGSLASLWGIIPNLLVIGSDVFREFFFDSKTGEFVLWHVGETEIEGIKGAYNWLVLPQIWSVGNEIVFYATAPLLSRLNGRRFGLVFLVALIVCPLGQVLGFAWYNLLPTNNFIYFMLGMLAHRISPRVGTLPIAVKAVLASVPFALAFGWQALPGPPSPGFSGLWVWAPLVVCLPALFSLSKDSKADAAIGELSYPIYLVHGLFAWPAAGTFGNWGVPLAILLSCMLAWILVVVVDRPIERWRRSLAARAHLAAQQSRLSLATG